MFGSYQMRLCWWQRSVRCCPSQRVVNMVFQPSAAPLELFDFLVRREIDFLLNSVDGLVQRVILLKHLPEILVACFELFYSFPIFRKLPNNRMMEVHGSVSQIRFLIFGIFYSEMPFSKDFFIQIVHFPV